MTLSSLQTFELETAETLVQLSILLFLVVVVGFFVAAELAIVSASKGEVYSLSQETDDPRRKAAELVHHAQNHLEQYLSVTQTGTTAGSLLLGWLGEDATVHWIEPWISRIPIDRLPVMITSHAIAATVAFLLVTYVEILLGELVPKVLAANAPEQTALLLIRPLEFCSRLFFPALVVLNASVRLLTGGIARKPKTAFLSASEAPLVQNDAYSASIAGSLDLLTINEKLGLRLPIQEAYTTLAGFMIHQMGRVPSQGDRIQWSELELEAVRVTDDRVETILLRQVTRPLVNVSAEPVLVEESLASSP
ncbi:MAG: CNNM domain-containing protein [Phormidesmis sp. CAN_BIN36]|nr:CNNM domain-containing protein [Phormidesmis sp. CAN_BIN36]